MITPNIAPTKVLNPLSRGLFTAAKNSVSRIKNTTENISKAASESRSKAVSNKNQKFAMNFLEFFGSKKTAKILKKSLESIKKSIVSTLEIAKVLRASLGDITKVAKKSGLFGGIGGLVGLGIKLLFGKAALIALGVLAVGGLGALLIANKDAVFKFLNTNRKRLEGIIEPIIGAYLNRIFRGGEIGKINQEARNILQEEIKKLNIEDFDSKEDLIEQARSNAFDRVEASLPKINFRKSKIGDPDRLEFERKKRIMEAIKGGGSEKPYEVQGFLNEKNQLIAGTRRLANRLTTDIGFETSAAKYLRKTDDQKLNAIKEEIQLNGGNIDILETRMLNVLNRDPDQDERAFALDILSYLESLVEGTSENFEKEVLPSSKFPGKSVEGAIPGEEQIKNQFFGKPKDLSVKEQISDDSVARNSLNDNNMFASLPQLGGGSDDVIPTTSGSLNGVGSGLRISPSAFDRSSNLARVEYGIAAV